jgi:hypothetical protein
VADFSHYAGLIALVEASRERYGINGKVVRAASAQFGSTIGSSASPTPSAS